MGERPIIYRLSSIDDPEERLEDAAMWKALHDEFGDAIEPLTGEEEPPRDAFVFGRSRRFKMGNANPVSGYLPYWTDPAFLANAGRSFQVLPYEQAMDAVSKLHAEGKGAFVKSTAMKHAVFRIPVGTDPDEEIGDMAYSFIDGGPKLMVQELCTVEFEHRFFCIDREVVTHSPVQWQLTPIDRPRPGTVFRTPAEPEGSFNPQVFKALLALAERVAGDMREPHAVVDCGMINGVPGVIEFNPMQIGQCGLYACDVRRLARAARKLIPTLPVSQTRTAEVDHG